MKTTLMLVLGLCTVACAMANEQMTAAPFTQSQQPQNKAAEANRTAEDRSAAAVEEAYWKGRSEGLQQSLQASKRESDRQESAARKVCGADFGRPRVGMSLVTAMNCLGDVHLVGQVNRADGVASVYDNGRVQLFVMDRKVVAWQARR